MKHPPDAPAGASATAVAEGPPFHPVSPPAEPGDNLTPRVPHIFRVPAAGRTAAVSHAPGGPAGAHWRLLRTPSIARGQGRPTHPAWKSGLEIDEPDATAPQRPDMAPAATTTPLSRSPSSSRKAELLIALSLVVILTALAVSNLDEIVARVNMIRLIADMSTIDTAIMDYYAQRGVYPVDRGGIGPARILVRSGALQNDPRVPDIPVYRNVTGYWITGPDAKGGHYGANRAVVKIGGVLYDRDHVKRDLHW